MSVTYIKVQYNPSKDGPYSVDSEKTSGPPAASCSLDYTGINRLCIAVVPSRQLAEQDIAADVNITVGSSACTGLGTSEPLGVQCRVQGAGYRVQGTDRVQGTSVKYVTA